MKATKMTTNNDETVKEELVEVENPKNKTKRTDNVPIMVRIFGICLILVGSILASVQGGIVTYLDVIPSGEMVMINGFYCSFFFLTIAQFYGVSVIKFQEMRWVIMRCLAGTLAFLTQVWSIQRIPLGDATALVMTMPIFAGIIARVWLKERYTLIHVLTTVFGIAGIFLIVKPSFLFPSTETTNIPDWYRLIPVLSAVIQAMEYVLQRKIGNSVNPLVICYWEGTSSLLAGFSYNLMSEPKFVNPGCYGTRLLALLCPVFGLYTICINKGLSMEKSATASLIRNVDVVLAYFIQVVIFNIPAEVLSLVGTALIVFGTVLITFTKALNMNEIGFEI